jgi:putative methionine-R-sulfoxide reductase with GAF domain
MTEQKVLEPIKFSTEEYKAIKERSLLYGAFIASIFGSILFIVLMINSIQTGQYSQHIPVGIAYLGLLIFTFIRKMKFEVRLYGLVLILTALGVASLIQKGILGDSRVYLLFAVFLMALMTNRLASIIFSSATTLFMIGIGVSNFLNILPVFSSIDNRGTVSEWILGILIFILFTAIIILISDTIVQRFRKSLTNELTLSRELDHERKNRNDIIQEQTAELTKRNSQRDLANQIAKDIASLTDQPSLLQKTVELIRDRFGFYHAGIFLLDAGKEFAVLNAATGEAGKTMLNQKHKLRAGQEGIVGRVVSTGEPRIALDVGADAVHFRNPLLPATRSEMALPLKVGDTIIGALDVQSQQESAFVKEDIDILQTIADQLAIGIERNRITERLETTIKDLSKVSESVFGKTWQSYTKKAGALISFSAGVEGEKAGIETPAEIIESMNSGRIIEEKIKVGDEERLTMVIPLIISGHPLGSMKIQFGSEGIDDIRKHMFTTIIADRLSVSLESARKNEEAQIRANNERLVRELTAKVQSYTSIDDILKTAALELGRSLGLSEVEIGLLPPSEEQSER